MVSHRGIQLDIGNETDAHIILKKKAIDYLMSKGHEKIECEYRFQLEGENSELGARSIVVDVIAFDGQKTVVECGNISVCRPVDWAERVRDLGYKIFRIPYGYDKTPVSKVTRLKMDILEQLAMINPDVNEAISMLLAFGYSACENKALNDVVIDISKEVSEYIKNREEKQLKYIEQIIWHKPNVLNPNIKNHSPDDKIKLALHAHAVCENNVIVPSVERAVKAQKIESTISMKAEIKPKEEYVQCMDDCKFQHKYDKDKCGHELHPYNTRSDCANCPEFERRPKKK